LEYIIYMEWANEVLNEVQVGRLEKIGRKFLKIKKKQTFNIFCQFLNSFWMIQ